VSDGIDFGELWWRHQIDSAEPWQLRYCQGQDDDAAPEHFWATPIDYPETPCPWCGQHSTSAHLVRVTDVEDDDSTAGQGTG
jgi:hypothetical protein